MDWYAVLRARRHNLQVNIPTFQYYFAHHYAVGRVITYWAMLLAQWCMEIGVRSTYLGGVLC